MADETLSMLMFEVRWKTLKLLETVSEDQARWKPAGMNNNILWHAGHALVVVEHLSVSAVTGNAPEYPEGWFEMFSWKSQPALIAPDRWPRLEQVVAQLVKQRDRGLAALEAVTSEKLASVIPGNAKGRTIRWSVLHGLHDESGHQGEIHLLKKLQSTTSG